MSTTRNLRRPTSSALGHGLILGCLAGILWTARAATPEKFIWSNPNLGAALTQLPAPWQIETHSENSVVLIKQYEGDQLKLTERMTFQVSRDTSANLDDAIEKLRAEGYCLVRLRRVGNAEVSAPFWLLSGPADPETACWLGLLLHAGKVYSLMLQYSPLDLAATTDFDQVLEGFRLSPDPREEGWAAYTRGDYPGAERAFRKIIGVDRGDANARYGLGLSELALGDTDAAISDLQRAESPLRGAEDVRRALGRAEFQRGHLARAVALWVQVLGDEPGWEGEVGPWIDQAVHVAGTRTSSIRSTAETTGLSRHLTLVVGSFLANLRRGDTFRFYALQADFQHTRDDLIADCLAGAGSAFDLAVLHASCAWDRGIRQGMSGSHDNDEMQINEAQYLLARPFQDLRLQP